MRNDRVRKGISQSVATLAALAAIAMFSPATANEVSCSQRVPSHQQGNKCKRSIAADTALVKATNRWLQAYGSLPRSRQKFLTHAARHIAKLRRRSLKRLIHMDPERAYALSLTPIQRQGLPDFVVRKLESRIHTTGDIVQLITESIPEEPTKGLTDNLTHVAEIAEPYLDISWSVRIDGESHRAFVYGMRNQHQTEFDTPIHGILLDDVMAISDSPLYLYDELEKQELGFKPEEIIATSGGFPIRIPDMNYFTKFEQEIRQRILQFGPIYDPIRPDEWSTGEKRVLIFRVQFRGDDREPPWPTDGEIGIWFSAAQAYFQRVSQGRTSLFPTIHGALIPVLELDYYQSFANSYTAHRELIDNAVRQAEIYGLNPESYDRVVILAAQIFDRAMGAAPRNGRNVVLSGRKSRPDKTFIHELGHTFGLPHSQFLLALNPDNPIGPGESLLYGDQWDMMGSGVFEYLKADPQRRHFNVFFKYILGWIPTISVIDGSMGGDFRLYAHDDPSPENTRAIFVRAGDGWVYWLGRRSLFPENESISEGIEVRRVRDHTVGDFLPVELLDLDARHTTIPDGGRSDFHSLRPGIPFIDEANGIEINNIIVAEDEMGREFSRVYIRRF